MRLYHGTTFEAAETIENDGFRDSHLAADVYGVFLSAEPLGYGNGAVFVIEVPDDMAAEFVCVHEGHEEDMPREWCIPAAALNAYPRRRADDDLTTS